MPRRVKGRKGDLISAAGSGAQTESCPEVSSPTWLYCQIIMVSKFPAERTMDAQNCTFGIQMTTQKLITLGSFNSFKLDHLRKNVGPEFTF